MIESLAELCKEANLSKINISLHQHEKKTDGEELFSCIVSAHKNEVLNEEESELRRAFSRPLALVGTPLALEQEMEKSIIKFSKNLKYASESFNNAETAGKAVDELDVKEGEGE